MKQSIILQPIHNTSVDILTNFANGKPLTADQFHFLDSHQSKLSSPLFDPIYKYYVDAEKKKRKFHGSFLMPAEEINHENMKRFKKRMELFLQQKSSNVTLQFTAKQLLKFKEVCAPELIYFHGNQFLTGAPFIPGAIAPVIIFQWGNFFGVVKYVVMAEEKSMKANTLIYFEDMQDRSLDECVLDYGKKLSKELTMQNTILAEHKFEPEEFDKFLIKSPVLTPSLKPVGL